MINSGSKPPYYDYKTIIQEQKQMLSYLENRYIPRKKKPSQAIVTNQEKNENSPSLEIEQPVEKLQDVRESMAVVMDDSFSEAISLYKKALEGNSEAVKQSHTILKELNAKEPENPLIEAYYGCLTTLLGRDELDPNQRFKWVMKGLKILDKAVGSKPGDVEIRSLRGRVCLRLPEMYFHRNSTAVEDFSYLASCYEKDNSLFPEEEYHQILFDLGEAFKGTNKLADAQKTWDKLLSVTKDPRYTELVKRAGGRVKTAIQPESNMDDSQKSIQSTPYYSYNPQKKNLEEGFEYHKQAVRGNRQELKKAFEFFEASYKEDPLDPDAAAYYADCLSLMAKDSTETNTLFGNAIQSMKIFDEAVNAKPEDMMIRMLRAKHSLRLPETFFKRTATAISDLQQLEEEYEKGSSFIDRDLYLETLYLLGKSYQRLGVADEAVGIWNKLKDQDTDSLYLEKIQQEMKSMEGAAYTFDVDSTENIEKLFKEGVRLHNLGVEGNAEAAEKSKKLLEKVYQKVPGKPIVEAYYGSSVALTGRYALDTQSMFGNAIQGMKLVNHAVSQDNYNPKLRYLRGNLLFNLPEAFFHMGDKAVKDYKYVAVEYEKNPEILTKEKYWQLLYDLGVCYQRIHENELAIKTWKKLLSISEEPKYRESLSWIIEGGSHT